MRSCYKLDIFDTIKHFGEWHLFVLGAGAFWLFRGHGIPYRLHLGDRLSIPGTLRRSEDNQGVLGMTFRIHISYFRSSLILLGTIKVGQTLCKRDGSGLDLIPLYLVSASQI